MQVSVFSISSHILCIEHYKSCSEAQLSYISFQYTEAGVRGCGQDRVLKHAVVECNKDQGHVQIQDRLTEDDSAQEGQHLVSHATFTIVL